MELAVSENLLLVSFEICEIVAFDPGHFIFLENIFKAEKC